MRELRLYDPDYYCEVTLRTNCGDFGFDLNDADLRDQIYGLFAEAIERYAVEVFVFHFMSNHYHGVYGFRAPEQLVMFFAFLHGNLARLAHRTNGTHGTFWAPLKVFAVAKDAESVGRRVRYIMGQAVAAGLVDHPGQFPGASSVDAMLYGTRLLGRRMDNTRRCRDAARLVGGAKPDAAYETWVELPLTVPHCWAELSGEELRHMYAGIAADLVGERVQVAEVGKSGGECLIDEITDNSLGQLVEGANAEPAPPSDPDPELEPPPKQSVPVRQAEDGGKYSQGRVKPKHVDGKRNRSRPPRLLAADQRLVDAYEQRYQESVTVYYIAKARWCKKSKVRDGALRGAKIRLPAWMLLGTLPLRLPGQTWAGARTVPG